MPRVLLCLALTMGIHAARAQGTSYPQRPINIIVPFGPGGGTDFLTRLVATKLAEMNQWTVTVDFRPGAGGTIGMSAAVSAAPNGYVLVMGATDNLSIAPWLQKNLSYDALKDVSPVAKVADSPILFVAAEGSAYKGLGDVVGAAKAAPEKLSLGTAGTGSVSHLAAEAFQSSAGIKITHVPYKGSGAIMADLMGGHVHLAASSIPSALPLIKAGKLRALGVTSLKRSSILPGVPTFAEQGHNDFVINVWYGIMVPAGVPASIIARLNSDINKILDQPGVRESIQAQGAEIDPGSPEKFGAMIQADYVKWRDIIRKSGVKAD